MPASTRFTPRLTEEELHQVVQWYAQFHAPKAIPAMIQEKFHKTVSRTYVYEVVKLKRWRPLIDRYRQEWAMGVAEVPIAHKRYRLDTLMDLLAKVEADRSIQPHRKEARILRILEKARLEMEEKKTEFTNVYFTAITHATDEELLARREQLVKRIQAYTFPTRRRADAVGHRREVLAETGDEHPETEGAVHPLGEPPRDGANGRPPAE